MISRIYAHSNDVFFESGRGSSVARIGAPDVPPRALHGHLWTIFTILEVLGWFPGESITVLTPSKRAAVVSYGGAGFSHELPCAAIWFSVVPWAWLPNGTTRNLWHLSWWAGDLHIRPMRWCFPNRFNAPETRRALQKFEATTSVGGRWFHTFSICIWNDFKYFWDGSTTNENPTAARIIPTSCCFNSTRLTPPTSCPTKLGCFMPWRMILKKHDTWPEPTTGARQLGRLISYAATDSPLTRLFS